MLANSVLLWIEKTLEGTHYQCRYDRDFVRLCTRVRSVECLYVRLCARVLVLTS